jgi:hypothetical protein
LTGMQVKKKPALMAGFFVSGVWWDWAHFLQAKRPPFSSSPHPFSAGR